MEYNWEQLERWQPLAMKLIRNALQMDRIAHAYLFEGRRGTGKKEIAIYFAKSLFCQQLQNGYLPCDTCIQCRRIKNGNHPDLYIVEADGASIKKEQIKSLQQEFSKKSVESGRKVYIINHTEKMTISAANSLLKFLEEPPSLTTAILLTENLHQILPTIQSRCQHVPFRSLPKSEISQILIEKGIPKEKARLFAHLTNDVEEAVAMSQDEWLLQGQKIVIKLYETLTKQTLADALFFIENEWLSHFKERDQMDIGLTMLLYIYRDLLFIQLDQKEQMVYLDQYEQWKQQSLRFSGPTLSKQIQAIIEAKKRLRANVNGPLLMEQLIIKLQEGSIFV